MKQSIELKKFFKSIFHIQLPNSVDESDLNVILDPTHNIDKTRIRTYLKNFHTLRGWFSILSAKTLIWLDFIQKEEGIKGNLFEIGVFLGKSAIMLGLFTNQKDERLGLCDNFQAGKNHKIPQKEILFKNLSDYCGDLSFIDFYAKESNQLTLNECKNCRFFHIDGGHTIEQLMSDLKLAEDAIIDKGLIIIDDFFNVGYPEVTEGIYKYLQRGSLVPIIIAFTKLVLCKRAFYPYYFEKISNSTSWPSYLSDETVYFANATIHNYNVLTGRKKPKKYL